MTASIIAKATAPRPRLIAYHAADVMTMPSPVEVIEGMAWAGLLTLVVSESGGGKSFVMLDQMAHVSAGLSWHRRATLQGSCVYIGFEGDDVARRLRALRMVSGHHLENVYAIRASEPISPQMTRESGEQPSRGEIEVIEALAALSADLDAAGRPPITFVGIDTVRASLAGSEDNSEHVSAYLRAGRRIIARHPTIALALNHHAGWQDGDTQRKRERGSSAWRGNCDATIYLEAGDYDKATGETPLTIKTLKARDAERAGPMHLIRRRVELPGEVDRHGQPVTSCVIEADRRSREDRASEAAEATASAERAVDLKTLRVIVDRPELATSIDRIRVALGARKAVASESVARLVRLGWVLPGGRGEPYSLTSEGAGALAKNDQKTKGTKEDRTGPGTRPHEQDPVPPLRGTGTADPFGTTRRGPDERGDDAIY